MDSYLYLGKAYAATGDYNYASSVYSDYLSKQGPDAEIYNQLGLCELEKKDYQKALEAFQAGKQIEGNSLMQTLSFNEIVAYEYLQDYQKAAVLLKAYLQLPGRPDGHPGAAVFIYEVEEQSSAFCRNCRSSI